MNKKLWFFMMLVMVQGLQARYFAPKKVELFYDELNNNEFVVACFLPDPRAGEELDKQMRDDIRLLEKTMQAVSASDLYKKDLQGQVEFVAIDTSRDGAQELMEKYQIKVDKQPEFVLFKQGKIVTTMADKVATLDGFVTKADLMDFINDYFGKDFDDIIAKRAEQDAQDREMQLARYQAAASYRYPYGMYAPYNPWGSPGPYIYAGYAQYFPYGYGYNGYAFFIP